MENKPWWNDGDKVSGLAATAVVITFAVLLVACVVKLITMMF